MWNRKSISFQIIITVIISFLALFLFFSILTTRLYYRNVTDIMQESQQHSLTQLNESFDTFYQQIIYTMIQLDGDSTIKQYLTKDPADAFEYYRMQQYVHDFLQVYTGFFPNSGLHLILYGENGQTYTTYNETLHLENTGILGEDFVRQAEKNHRRIGVSYSYPGLTSYTENRNYIYFVHSLYDPYRSRYYGTILIVIDKSCITRLYTDLLQDNNSFSVIAEDGFIILDSNNTLTNSYDSGLLSIAKKETPGILEYKGEKWIPSSVYNQYFNFYILQLTKYDAITSRVFPSILRALELCCIVYLIVIGILVYLFKRITHPIHRLSIAMQNVSGKDLLFRPQKMEFSGCSEARLLGDSFNEMFSKLEYYTKKLMQEQNIRYAAELNSLQYQINPHFIYNTLASIKYLSAAGQREKVITGINSLTKLLRKTLGDSRETIPLEQELDLLQDYFSIQQLRYGDGIRLSLNIKEDCLFVEVPRFFLQPLVENSIFHGFSTSTPNGCISIYATISGALMKLEIMDNGAGIPEDILSNIMDVSARNNQNGLTKIGLKNIEDRIKMIYGSAYGLNITSSPGYGTQVTIQLPVLHFERGNYNEESVQNSYY